jgi:hypothetical protein
VRLPAEQPPQARAQQIVQRRPQQQRPVGIDVRWHPDVDHPPRAGDAVIAQTAQQHGGERRRKGADSQCGRQRGDVLEQPVRDVGERMPRVLEVVQEVADRERCASLGVHAVGAVAGEGVDVGHRVVPAAGRVAPR